MDILPLIPDESVDMILTDPPYNIGYAQWDTFFNIEQVTNHWHRILKPNGSVFTFAGWSFVCELITRFDKQFTLNDWIIYDRIKGRGAKKRLVSTREDLLWYVKSKEWVFNKDIAYSTIKKKTGGLGAKNGKECRALSNVWTDISPIVPWSAERYDHPTQKPMAIAKRILDVFANDSSVILDCYMGGGSFGIASIHNNHTFVGIEQHPQYYSIAKQRMFQ